MVNRKILNSESDSKYTFVRLLIGYGYVLNFMSIKAQISERIVVYLIFFLEVLKILSL